MKKTNGYGPAYFSDALIKYTGGVFTIDGPNATAHIFATYPAPYLSTMNGLADQVRPL